MSFRSSAIDALIAVTQLIGFRLRNTEGKVLCKGFVIPWEGRIHLIGIPKDMQLRSVPLVEPHLSYWRQSIAWEQASPPNFKALHESPKVSGVPHVCHAVICHISPAATLAVYQEWRAVDPDASVVIAYGGSHENFLKLDPGINAFFVPDASLRTAQHTRERQQYQGVYSELPTWLEKYADQTTHVHLVEFDAIPVAAGLGRTLIDALQDEGADVIGYGLLDLWGTTHPHNRYELSNTDFLGFIESLSRREDKYRILTMLGCSSFWTFQCFRDVANHPTPDVYLEIGMPSMAHHLGYRIRPLPHYQERFVSFTGDFTSRIDELKEQGAWVIHPCKQYWEEPRNGSQVRSRRR